MRWLFVNVTPLKFDVCTPDNEPLGGTESCVCYLSRELARRGHDVTLLANVPMDGATTGGVRHVTATVDHDRGFYRSFDVIVTVNVPSTAAYLRGEAPDAKHLFWCHMMPGQEAIDNLRDVLDGHIVYLSEGQRSACEKKFGVAAETSVIGNAIAPWFEAMFSSPEDLRAAKRNVGAYTSTPYRGLDFLMAMKSKGIRAEIDVFSSLRVYQAEDTRPTINIRGVNDYGSVSQKELSQRLRPCAYLFYPCVFEETFCIAAIEAMAAGMRVITSDLGTLPETTFGRAEYIKQDDAFMENYRRACNRAVEFVRDDPVLWSGLRFNDMKFINENCTWKKRAGEWLTISGS